MGPPRTKRFTIRRQLGEGGMGVVYEAFDEERRAPVALKTLSRVDAESLGRFKREFHAMQGLVHPNLVALDELFCEDGQWFFTMALVDGVDLVTHVRAVASFVPSFDEAKLRDGLRQLLEGLAMLHAKDKVHRDVKPSNVMVTREGRVVLLDFGLVIETSLEDSDASVVGTPAYMAPEQAASLEIGPPADLYAVGVILYELLTGRLPIEGAQLQILLAKQTREVPPPASIAKGIPDDLDALCMRLLRFDPLRRPTATDALRSLAMPRARGSIAPRHTTEAPPPVGRTTELAGMRAAFEAIERGRLATTLVCGESGIGKSHLLRRFIAQVLAARPDALVLEGRCYERETVPYKTLDGIVDALSRRLSRLPDDEVAALLPLRSAMLAQVFPAMLRVSQVAREHASLVLSVEPHELRRRAFAALRELLSRVASRRPVVVAIDDLQWADEDGLRALAEILRPPDAPSLLLVGTVRTTAGDDDGALEKLRAAIPGDTHVVPLAKLTHDEARELVVSLLQGSEAPEADPAPIVKLANGHPLFLEELARHVASGGPANDGVTLDDAICARVSLLEPRTRALIELIAVAGKPTPQEVIASAAHYESSELNRRVSTLRVSSLARLGGARWADAVEPYHDRVREAVLARLSTEARRALHESLAIAFEASSHLDPETLATHWREAHNDARAAKYSLAAGDQATKAFAFERAAQWYERAFELSPEGPTGRLDLRLKLGGALAHAGRGALAAMHFEAAAAASPRMQALDLRRRAAEELLTAGRFDDGDRVLEDVLAAVGIGLPRTPLAALIGLLFFRFLLLLRGLKFRERAADEIPAQALTRLEACNGVGRILGGIDNVRGAYFQTRSLLAALSLGEPSYVSHALAIEAAYAAAQGNAARSARLMEEARAIARRTENVQLGALIDASASIATFVLGDFREALAHGDRANDTMRDHCPDAAWERRLTQISSVWAIAWSGDLKELGARVDQGVRDADQRGDVFVGSILRTGVPHLAWLRTGDVAMARAVVLGATKGWSQRGYHSLHYWSLMAQTRIELYEGDGRAAYLRVSHEWSQLTRAMVLQVQIIAVEAIHLRASAALAAAALEKGTERARMIRAAERDARKLDGMHWSVATSFAHVVRAGAASLRGDEARAAKDLDAGARGFDELAMKLHAMSAKWHVGRLRGGDEGRTIVTQAEAWMTEHGVASAASMARMLAPGFR